MTHLNPRAPNNDESLEVHAQRAFGVVCQFRVLCSLKPAEIGSLFLRTYNDWSNDSGTRLGAALAYYTLFSIAPILIVVTGVAGLFVSQTVARGYIAPWLDRLLSPEGARAAELMLSQFESPTGGILATLAGLVTLFLGTSALVSELRQSLNLVWRVNDPSQDTSILDAVREMVSDRLYAFLVVVGAGLLVILSLLVSTAVAAVGTYVQGWLPLPEVLLQTINFIMAFVLTTAMFAVVYKVVPDAHVAWGDACVGAALTAILFNIGGMLFSVFVGKAAVSVYGTAASVLALLLWVFCSAQVFFLGAELTRIFANQYGGRIVPRHRSVSGRLPREPHHQSIA